MGLIGKLFKGGGDARPSGPSSQFAESLAHTSVEQTKSRNAPRRDLVKVVLRENMRRHGIPTDWLDCRTLSVLTHQHKSGMHVQFLVREGDHQLLQWVHAFQESFWELILKMDPAAREWLFSVGWEFYGKSIQGFNVMPDPRSWSDRDTEQNGGDTQPPEEGDDHASVATDLQALQALMSVPAELVDLPDPPPGKKPR